MRAFLSYYKWHIFFVALFAFCIASFTFSSCTKSEPDLIITYINTESANPGLFKDTKRNLERFLHDADGNDKKEAELVAKTCDTQSDLDELFEALCTVDDCDIILTTKETFERFEEKDMFDTSTNYVIDTGTGKYDVLTDENGRVYAVSIEGNDYLQNMGFDNTKNLYLAVVTGEPDREELTAHKKNARNIAQVIIKEGDV